MFFPLCTLVGDSPVTTAGDNSPVITQGDTGVLVLSVSLTVEKTFVSLCLLSSGKLAIFLPSGESSSLFVMERTCWGSGELPLDDSMNKSCLPELTIFDFSFSLSKSYWLAQPSFSSSLYFGRPTVIRWLGWWWEDGDFDLFVFECLWYMF